MCGGVVVNLISLDGLRILEKVNLHRFRKFFRLINLDKGAHPGLFVFPPGI